MDMIVKCKGGTILAVSDCETKSNFDFSSLDGGKLSRIFRKFAPNVHTHCAQFEALLTAFCAHTDSDRWEAPLLQSLSEQLGCHTDGDKSVIQDLDWQPKDGALSVSLHGTVTAA